MIEHEGSHTFFYTVRHVNITKVEEAFGELMAACAKNPALKNFKIRAHGIFFDDEMKLADQD